MSEVYISEEEKELQSKDKEAEVRNPAEEEKPGEKVLSIKQSNRGYEGTITTSRRVMRAGKLITRKREIKYVFDTSTTCCNEHGIDESMPLRDIVGQILTKIDLGFGKWKKKVEFVFLTSQCKEKQKIEFCYEYFGNYI